MTASRRSRTAPFGATRVGKGVGARAEPQEIAETLDIVNVSVPRVASPGDRVPVRVTLSCKGLNIIGACESAIRVSSQAETVRVPQSGGEQFSEGNNRSFTATLTMTESDMTVTVEAIERGDATGVWNVEDTSDAVVTSATPAEAVVSNWGPWIVGGGAVGLGGAVVMGEDPLLGVGVGAGVGAGAKVATDRFPTISVPNVGLFELIAAGTVGILGLMILRTFRGEEGGVGDFASAAGEGIGTAASAATGGAGKIAGALR